MSFGCKNRILRVDLSTRSITVDEPGVEFFKKYLGGTTMIAYFLNKEVVGDCDPLGEENKIIVAPSVITGAPIPGSSRFSVGAKSPLTGGFSGSEAGGFFGPELKWAGYDAIIVEGKAEKPSYLWISNDTVEIRDAGHLWGKDTGVVQEMIREENGEKRARILQTGQGGENLIRYAALTNDIHHWNGRSGLGAVFGSKNLRAIAVKGNDKDFIKEGEAIKSYAKWFSTKMQEGGLKDFATLGTTGSVLALDSMGLLPTKNFKYGSFDEAAKIDGSTMINEGLEIKKAACFGCPVRCKHIVKNESSDENKNIDPLYGGPEYETLGALGAICGVSDLVAVCKGNELVARYGLDSISTGVTIAFAMECFENGIITLEDTNGLDLSFGNADAVLELIKLITKREGIGDILAEGSYRAAQKFGKGAEQYSMTSKKQEFAAHEPRGKWNVGLGYAVSPCGADHMVVEHDHCFMGEPNTDPDAVGGGDIFPLFQYGIREPLVPISLDEKKLRAFVVLQRLWTLMDTLDICVFVAEPSRRMITLKKLPDLINSITGWDITLPELVAVAERGIVLSRLFNAKCGITSEDEVLPERMFEGLENGILKDVKMDRAIFEDAKATYYQMTGMNEAGHPIKGKLVELALEEFV